MKFMHISDLHLGKSVHEHSMIEDQRRILDQIAEIARNEGVDGVIIAGDVYDKGIPSEDAVKLLSGFLNKLNETGKPVYMISGNHDSQVRMSFLNDILSKQDLHISDSFGGKAEKITVEDDIGKLNIFLLPFFKRSNVRALYDGIETPDDALKAVLDNSDIDPKERNILIAHQFFVAKGRNTEMAGSETQSVGGTDSISAELLEDFDYVALGHIHKPQSVGSENVRYCGSPLKYSESEYLDRKSVVIFEVGKKGKVDVELKDLTPIRDLRVIEGTVSQLIEAGRTENPDDYVFIKLTEEELDARQKLSQVYGNILEILLPSACSGDGEMPSLEEMKDKTPLELFGELYQKVNGKELTPEQEKAFQSAVEEITGAGQ